MLSISYCYDVINEVCSYILLPRNWIYLRNEAKNAIIYIKIEKLAYNVNSICVKSRKGINQHKKTKNFQLANNLKFSIKPTIYNMWVNNA